MPAGPVILPNQGQLPGGAAGGGGGGNGGNGYPSHSSGTPPACREGCPNCYDPSWVHNAHDCDNCGRSMNMGLDQDSP
jgi:hypothetical protein